MINTCTIPIKLINQYLLFSDNWIGIICVGYEVILISYILESRYWIISLTRIILVFIISIYGNNFKISNISLVMYAPVCIFPLQNLIMCITE